MRKVMLISFMIVMMLVGTISIAEEKDYSSLSDEDLIVMFNDVCFEIETRMSISNDRIGRGEYIVGQDIKSGFYTFLCLETDYYDSGTPDNYIKIYNLSEDGSVDKVNPVFWEGRFSIGSHIVFHIIEGTKLEIYGCSGFLNAVEPSWAQ